MSNRRAAILALLVVAIAASACAAAPSIPSPSLAGPRTAAVTRAAVSELVSLAGTIEPTTQYRLSFRTPGRVAELLVVEGTRVTKGQALARLDAADFETAVGAARAGVASAQARFDQVTAGASDQDVADAKRAFDQARTGYDSNKASFRTNADALGQDLRAASDLFTSLRNQIVRVLGKLGPAAQPVGTPQPPSTDPPSNTPEPTVSTAKADARAALTAVNQAQASRDLGDVVVRDNLAAALVAYDSAYHNVLSGMTAFDLAVASGGDATQANAFYQAALTPYTDASARVSLALDAVLAPLTATATSLAVAMNAIQTGGSRFEVNLDGARYELAIAQSMVAGAQQTFGSDKAKVTQAASALAVVTAAIQGTYLTAQSAVSRVQATPRPADLSAAYASVQTALSQLQAAQANLDGATLKAPAAGVVLAIAAKVGETVSGPVVTINTEELRLHSTVGETDVSRLRVGQRATVTVRGLPAPLTGAVSAIDAGARQPGVPLFGVDVALDAPGAGVRPGMTGSAKVAVLTRDGVVAVPTAAIRVQGAKRTVQVLREGKAVATEIQIGIANDTLTEVLSGLVVGDQVVVASLPLVTDSPAPRSPSPSVR